MRLRPYTAILLTVLLACAALPVSAQEIPFGVSPKEITVAGSVTFDEPHVLGYGKGQLTQEYVYKVGNRTGVRLSGLDYVLRFWNVGELGGTSGYLFWKKDFGRASLHISYDLSGPGQVITGTQETPMGTAYQMEEAREVPTVEDTSCSLRFTGGPTGTFRGACGNGATIKGRLGGAGAFAVFEDIQQPEDPKEVSLALSFIGGQDMRLNGQFGDWKVDETQLEDSGARFSSLNGQIEMRHDVDPKGWELAQLKKVIYVLDHVKTDEDSTAILSFTDLSTFLVRPETEIVVTTPPKRDSKLKLVAGTIYANVKKMLKDGTMEVEMSQAVAGIKGTRFILTDTGTESTIRVTEGTVAFRAKSDGTETLVHAGESVTASGTGLGAPTSFDAAAADADLLVRTAEPAVQEPTEESDEPAGTGAGRAWWILVAAVIGALGWRLFPKRTPATPPPPPEA